MVKGFQKYLGIPILLILSTTACNKDETSPDLMVEGIQFEKRSAPVWSGQWTAADPSVVRDGDTLLMYYSSLLLDPVEKLVIAGAKSVDGINWIPTYTDFNQESVALDRNENQWDNHPEAVSVIPNGNELWMYYCGYPVESEVSGTIVAEGQIGLAKSDGNSLFTRHFDYPVLALGSENSNDENALFSPTVIQESGLFYMFYVGYCIENCSPGFLGLLGATSMDGENWTKLADPILTGSDFNLSWASVIKEPSIVKGPDGIFYLFFSGDSSIGIAKSESILGPYEAYPDPILEIEHSWEQESVIAPSVLIENGKARIWYMGVVTEGASADFAIGYAEADFPFDW